MLIANQLNIFRLVIPGSHDTKRGKKEKKKRSGKRDVQRRKIQVLRRPYRISIHQQHFSFLQINPTAISKTVGFILW